jgi:hypothetical protein
MLIRSHSLTMVRLLLVMAIVAIGLTTLAPQPASAASRSVEAVSGSRAVAIQQATIKGIYVQSVIRAGGQGRVSVYLNGPAPAGGLVIRVISTRPTILPLPINVTIPAGESRLRLVVNAANVSDDVPVDVIVLENDTRFTGSTIVRNLS